MGNIFAKTAGNPASIAIYPFGAKDAYQILLAEALEKRGCTLYKKARVDKTLPFHIIKACHGAKVLHLHWISGLYEGRTRVRFVLRTLLFCLSLLAIRIRRIRLVLTLHNLLPHDANFERYHFFARKLIARCVHKIIVHSAPARKMAAEYLGSPKKFQVILHGHYLDFYPAHISKAEARRFLNIAPNKKVVLFLGNIKPYKGLEELLSVAEEFEQKNMLLLIAGQGADSYVSGLRQQLSKNVILHEGFVPRHQVQYYMKAAECLILPYRQSLTSGAAVLGLSFHLPLVATNTVSFKHLLEEKLCVTCEPSNPPSIVAAIEEIFSWDYDEFKKRCDHFLAACNWDKIAEEHLLAFGFSFLHSESSAL